MKLACLDLVRNWQFQFAIALPVSVFQALVIFSLLHFPATGIAFVAPGPGMGLVATVIVLFQCICWCLIAVSWHRLVLLRGQWSLANPFDSFTYLPRYILVAASIAAAALLATLPLFALLILYLITAHNLDPQHLIRVSGFFWNEVVIVASFVALRLSLMLPASAIGKEMDWPTAWRGARYFSTPCFILALAATVLNYNLTTRTQAPHAMEALTMRVTWSGLMECLTESLVIWPFGMMAIAIVTAIFRRVFGRVTPGPASLRPRLPAVRSRA